MSCLNCCKNNVNFTKKVSFNNVVKVVYFHPTPVETNVSWQQVARDRLRFKRRMLDIEQKIGWIFDSQHRRRVFEYKNVVHKDIS